MAAWTGCGTGRALPEAAHAAPTVVTVTNRDNGRTITLVLHQRLRVVLSSTYWTLQESSNPAALRMAGRPRITPRPSGCVPGAGCGTATATYGTVAPGSALVTATRTSCGEAMGCTGATSRFSLHVVVHRA
jgi:hypothetical protein